MPKKLSNEIPQGYPVCNHADCPLSEKCLHQIAYDKVLKSEEYLKLINPGKCSKDNSCKYFRVSEPVVYARGLTKMQKQMYPDQYKKFTEILFARFGRNAYFERRKGEYAMPPSEQKTVLEALRKAGVEKEMEFDSYEENYNWYDK